MVSARAASRASREPNINVCSIEEMNDPAFLCVELGWARVCVWEMTEQDEALCVAWRYVQTPAER